MDHRAVQHLEPARPGGLADHDLGDVLRPCVGEQIFGDRRPPPGRVSAAPPRRSARRRVSAMRSRSTSAKPGAARGLHGERGPGGVQPVGQALGVAHEAGGARVLVDADEHPLAGRPGAGDGVRLHVAEKLGVDPLGDAAQRQLAQRGQVAGREIVGERPAGGLADIDLAVLQPLDQVVGGDVDDLDVVGALDQPVRDGLAHPDAGDLRHHVVEALDVLDVHRGVDVDAGGEQLLDVDVALGMPALRRVGMRELVDQHQLRAAGEDGVEVHLLENPAPVGRRGGAGTTSKPRSSASGLGAAVGLDDADDHVDAIRAPGARPRPAWRRSCRRRAPRRGRSSAGRASRAGLPRAARPARGACLVGAAVVGHGRASRAAMLLTAARDRQARG